jgi:hypothetical protein
MFPRDLGTLDPPDQFFGLATEHRAADHLDATG